MGRLSEYDHVKREALRKGISRQPDPLPRGAVVAGEPPEPPELEIRGYEAVDGGGKTVGVYRTQHEALVTGTTFCVHNLARRSDAQERIRALEARLEELRPVVRAAIQYKHQEPFFEPVQALSAATREWAEGES